MSEDQYYGLCRNANEPMRDAEIIGPYHSIDEVVRIAHEADCHRVCVVKVDSHYQSEMVKVQP